MSEFKEKWCEYFIQVINPFLKKEPTKELIYDWFWYYTEIKYTDEVDLQVFVNNNTKEEYIWMSGIGLIEGCQKIVEEAISNGNILTIK